MNKKHLIIGIVLVGGYLLWRRNKRNSATPSVASLPQQSVNQDLGIKEESIPVPTEDPRFPKPKDGACPEGFEFLKLKCDTPPCPSGSCIKKANL